MLGKLNRAQIDNLLRAEVVGRIGCSAEGKVCIVPITYAYDGAYIYGYTIEGMKIDMMRKNPEVCFEVDKIIDLANWQSAVIWGRYEELEGSEAEEAVHTLVTRVHPLKVSETSRPVHGLKQVRSVLDPNMKMVAFRINVGVTTGRFERN